MWGSDPRTSEKEASERLAACRVVLKPEKADEETSNSGKLSSYTSRADEQDERKIENTSPSSNAAVSCAAERPVGVPSLLGDSAAALDKSKSS